MGKIRTVFHFLTLGIVDSNKEVARKQTPCVFTSSLTEDDFNKLAIDVAKPIKRLRVSTSRQYVRGDVRAQSGLSTWSFTLDFNDFGKVTGRYWIRYLGNADSQIPRTYADKLSRAIVSFKRGDRTHDAYPKKEPTMHTDKSKVFELIAELSKLHDQGILTDDEFQAKKAELLKKI